MQGRTRTAFQTHVVKALRAFFPEKPARRKGEKLWEYHERLGDREQWYELEIGYADPRRGRGQTYRVTVLRCRLADGARNADVAAALDWVHEFAPGAVVAKDQDSFYYRDGGKMFRPKYLSFLISAAPKA